MLKTDRLVLRAARWGDLDALFAVYSDPRSMRYWSTPPHDDRTITQANLGQQIAAAASKLSYFVIEKDGEVIGNAGLYRGNEVGFILSPACWRQGILSEAMGVLIPYLFETTGLAMLTADVDPRNEASVRLLTSLGFVETHRAENTFCIGGEWSDSVYFALPRPADPS